MRFLVDECTGRTVARWLREQGHKVFSVYEEARGAEDDRILQKAFEGGFILITNDKDFGEKIHRERRPHRGVILLRLDDERSENKINALRRLLEGYADRIENHFIVVSERAIRFAPRYQNG